MKNRINLFFASCLTFSLMLFSFSAEEEEKLPKLFSKLKGLFRATIKSRRMWWFDYIKEIKKVDSTYTTKSGKFNFELERNTHYMIELEKYGFEKSRVKVDTHRKGVAEENEGNFYDLAIDIEIFSEIADKKGSEEDKDILDFPIAMIEYNSKEDAFVANTKYTKYVKGEIKKIKGSVSSK